MAPAMPVTLPSILLQVLFLSCGLVSSIPVEPQSRREHPRLHGRSASDPVFGADFPDPSVMQDADGQWYAFGTEGNGKQVQAATAATITGPWELIQDVDLLPSPPPWATGRLTWAPDVQRLDDGTYLMYFSAQLVADEKRHGIGTASASTVLGPYTPASEPFAADLTIGGAIDASGFRDDGDGGRRYVLYKVDGNSLGTGGSCGNADEPRAPTPIIIQEVSTADGATPVGDPVQILDRTDDDGPLVEAPSLVRTEGGVYVLFFSSGCYLDTDYRTSYATADAVTGPYTRVDMSPLLQTGDALALTAPAGASAAAGAQGIAFHANCDWGRCMHVSSFDVDGDGRVTIGG